MSLSSTLLTLADCMAGEFDNREQAIAEPAWYVHLRLWHRPVPLFREESITLFAEQANVLKLAQPYRQRLLRIMQSNTNLSGLQVQYYSFKDPGSVQGAGANPNLLEKLEINQIDLLPGCVLEVTQTQPSNFAAFPPQDARCFFYYQGEKRQVSLGFEVSAEEFKSYDKGIDPQTGQAIWGALMGPYQFTKRQTYAINCAN